MTSPMPPGGFISSLLGGAMGTLAGTNPLQSSIDQLTNSVNRLTNTLGTLNLNQVRPGQQQSYGSATGSFPAVNVPGVVRQAGIGGGGPGGAGNVSPPTPFGRLGLGLAGVGMIGSSFAGYGQQQLPFQIGLNTYASIAMMGMNNAGMGNFGQNFSMLSNQPGLPITSSPGDYLAMTQGLGFLGGAPNYMSTRLGRAGFGAAASFGLTNPSLSGAMSASLAQQIYNPMLSMRMRLLGYSMTPRVMGSGLPQSIGNVAASLIQGWYGTNKVNPSQLYRTLSLGGKGFTNLQYLGLNPQTMAPLLEGFNKLFNAGYSPQEASTLFSQAASNNPTMAGRAQNILRNAGVTSVTSDIQKIKANQAQQTQRSINTAAGFDAALTSATDSLKAFNQGLNSILSFLHLNGALGAAGGAFGILSSTNHGNIISGLGGLGLTALAARMGASSALGGGLLSAGGIAGAAGSLGSAALTLGPAAALLFGLSKVHNPNGTNWLQQGPGGPGGGWNNFGQAGRNLKNWFLTDPSNWLTNIFGGGGFPNPTRVGGGAGSIPTSGQQQSRGRTSTMANVSGQAKTAVSAAERELGVPYVWGGEMPGVGFDCSGLVQWAYKQAGVGLPRTSQQQWAALKNKRVPLSQVQEGDIVFAAGSDGTPTAPGHEGLMINNRQLIQAPFTGADVQIIGFNPHAWVGAARPTGRGNFAISNKLMGNNTGASSSPGLYGNTGAAMSIGGSYGSVNEIDIISQTGGFMGAGASPFFFGGAGPASSSGLPGGPSRTTGGRGPMGNGSRNIAAEKAYAMQLLRARGWSNQFGALNSIIMAESSWRWNAANPSGAYGIPQALPGSKMASAGSDWRTNPDTQLRWMIDTYIPQRYGTPNAAWAFHQRNGWYGGGGWGGPGVRVVGDRGPEMQIDTGSGTLTINNAQTMSLLRSISQPQQTPWKNFTSSQYMGQFITLGQQPNSKAHINITFGPNSINVKTTMAGSDAQSAGQAIAQQTVAHMEREVLRSTIAQGLKN